MDVERILRRRGAQRQELLDRTRCYVASLPSELAIQAAVVFGSVARGDFNRWSDVDLLVIADQLQDELPERLAQFDLRPPLVQIVPWTPSEWHAELARGNPIAREAAENGVWLAGSAKELKADQQASESPLDHPEN